MDAINKIFNDNTGYFDVMMKKLNDHIKTQYNEQRIKGSEFATVYLQLLQLALSESLKLQQAEEALQLAKDKQEGELEVLVARKDMLNAQKDLYDRQKQGFRDKAQHDLAKTLLDGWSIIKSQDGTALESPDILNKSNLDIVFRDALKTVGLDIDILVDNTEIVKQGAVIESVKYDDIYTLAEGERVDTRVESQEAN